MSNLKILISVFLVCSLLSACGPKTDSFSNQAAKLPNGCLVTAEVEQAHLQLTQQSVWNRILVVYYNDHGNAVSHAWCLFIPLKGGELYAYDYRGSTHLEGDSSISADEACKQLIAFPTSPAKFVDSY